MASLRQRTVAGLGWNVSAQMLVQALQFVTSVVMARLLGPHDFGLMAMAVVFTGFASIFYEMSLGSALIQRKEISNRHLNSVFWMNVAGGSLLMAIFFAGAPYVARFYSQPSLRAISIAVSFTFLPAAMSVVPNALLDKSLSFRARFGVEAISNLVSGTVAITMALRGGGVWSLVGQALALGFSRMIVTWFYSPWRPAWDFDLAAFKELLRFSRNLAANNVFSYWGRNADRAIVGRFMGSVGLGVYGLAFRAVSLPLDLTTNATNAVMFPAFSAIQGNHETIGRVYLRATRMIALITFPLMIGLAALAEPAVLLIYGERWHASVGVIELLALSAVAQSVYNTAVWVFLSQGRSDILFRLGVFAGFVRALGAAIGMSWGITGVAWAYLIGTYGCLLYPTWLIMGRLVNLRVGQILKNLVGPFVCAAAMGAVLWIFAHRLAEGDAPWVRLVCGIPLGVLVYGFLVRQFRLEAWRDFQSATLEYGGNKFPILRRLFQQTAPSPS